MTTTEESRRGKKKEVDLIFAEAAGALKIFARDA